MTAVDDVTTCAPCADPRVAAMLDAADWMVARITGALDDNDTAMERARELVAA